MTEMKLMEQERAGTIKMSNSKSGLTASVKHGMTSTTLTTDCEEKTQTLRHRHLRTFTTLCPWGALDTFSHGRRIQAGSSLIHTPLVWLKHILHHM